MSVFNAAAYWEARYRAGGNSGAGSQGRLAGFKAAFINAFVADNAVSGTIDLGCGDGTLLSRLRVPGYVGVDVSTTALACCITRFPRHRFVPFHAMQSDLTADLAMSIDVVFHLVEDTMFAHYMEVLFRCAYRFVLVYASNAEGNWSAPHVRHRRFTAHVAEQRPEWRLLAHVLNPYPYDPDHPDNTSFSDFFVYARRGTPCCVRIPAAT
jgi:uncharacterized membrane protein